MPSRSRQLRAAKVHVSSGAVARIPRGMCDATHSAGNVRRRLSAGSVRHAKVLGYSERQYVRLALQDALRRAGLTYTVEIRAL